MTSRELIARDAAVMWHPYGTLPPAMAPLPVASANGVRIMLADGRQLIDGMSSWWAAIHGYRHPALDAAVSGQLGSMAHVMFGGLTHEPAVRLGEQLVAITPEGLQHVFLCDSGSVSVEVAIKMALQYWQARGEPARTRLMALRGAYHGDTFGAMSVCDPVRGMHQLFTSVLPQHLFAERPPAGSGVADGWRSDTEKLFAEHAADLAAVIVEPVVQGAGGMHFYDPAYVRVLAELCRRHDVLLIFDEIATGFGRTGALFAAELAGVTPDVMCLGKALTGGYLTLAATLCTRHVAEQISAGAGPLMHGPTFMANPLACSAALASLELLAAGDWRRDVPRIERALRAGLAPARELPGVAEVRVLGAIGVIQLDGPVEMQAATDAAVAHGVWLRPFADLVYTMPPYIATDEDVAAICAAAVAAAGAGRPGSAA